MLPLPVIEDVAANLANYKGCGESVMEMSHRSAEFKAILADAEQNLRDIMNIPDNYKVMFIQGGGTLQFAMVPLNLLRKSGKADYVITGTWAKKAAKEAEKFGDIKIVASSEDSTFSYIPKVNREDFRPDADYVHITLNNTIYGTHYPYIPDTGDIPLVADMSSCILSEPVDVTRFGVIYAGAQKNMAPAGLTVVIVREDLLGHCRPDTPAMFDWKLMADNGSMYNTPPCYPIYVAGLVYKWIKNDIGGLEEMKRINEGKANLLYDYLDTQSYYIAPVEPEARSMMNVTFVTGDPELDKKFAAEAGKAGFKNIKGHRSVGGMRASIYNAMPTEGVAKLVQFMKNFAAENPKA